MFFGANHELFARSVMAMVHDFATMAGGLEGGNNRDDEKGGDGDPGDGDENSIHDFILAWIMKNVKSVEWLKRKTGKGKGKICCKI